MQTQTIANLWQTVVLASPEEKHGRLTKLVEQAQRLAIRGQCEPLRDLIIGQLIRQNLGLEHSYQEMLYLFRALLSAGLPDRALVLGSLRQAPRFGGDLTVVPVLRFMFDRKMLAAYELAPVAEAVVERLADHTATRSALRATSMRILEEITPALTPPYRERARKVILDQLLISGGQWRALGAMCELHASSPHVALSEAEKRWFSLPVSKIFRALRKKPASVEKREGLLEDAGYLAHRIAPFDASVGENVLRLRSRRAAQYFAAALLQSAYSRPNTLPRETVEKSFDVVIRKALLDTVNCSETQCDRLFLLWTWIGVWCGFRLGVAQVDLAKQQGIVRSRIERNAREWMEEQDSLAIRMIRRSAGKPAHALADLNRIANNAASIEMTNLWASVTKALHWLPGAATVEEAIDVLQPLIGRERHRPQQ